MNTLRNTLGALCAVLVTASLQAADPVGTLHNVNGGQTRGKILWRNAAKEYVVTTNRGTFTFTEDQVESVDVDRPAALDAAIKRVQSGSGLSSAIKSLEELAKDYRHLTYDKEATQWLATAYLKEGKAADAVKACETIIRDDPTAAYTGAMAVQYWEALIKDGKGSQLNRHLEKAIASGDKVSAASALVARGDAIMARGSSRANCEEALRDGYLRVILLYADPATDAYPAALYKGAQAFDGMGQGARAGKLRETLKSACPNSEWARK